MSQFQRIIRPEYRMVIHQRAEEALEARRRLELAQFVDRPIILASRYNFSPPLTFSLHQSHDPILQAAYPMLAAHSYSTFSGYMNPLEIEPLFSDDAIFLHQAMAQDAPVCAMYAIGRQSLIAKVHLFLNQFSYQVFVQNQDKTIELGEWLKTLPQATGSVTGTYGYECLQAWWSAIGHPFRIMELPAELWTYIFELGFGMDVYPFANNIFGPPSGNPRNFRHTKYTEPATKGVLTLNKKIHGQLQPFAIKQTCKCFFDETRFMSYIASSSTGLFGFENLRTMELDFTNLNYFAFFDVEVPPFNRANCNILSTRTLYQQATILPNLAQLKHLYLRFTAPTDGIADPWHNAGIYNGFDNTVVRDFRGNPRHWDISCQEVVVDWILTFAKRYIQKIPQVTLYGCIKNSTKAKWDSILQDERNNTTGTELYDMTDAKKIIRNWDTEDLAPSCYCRIRCDVCRYETVPGQPGRRILKPFDPEDGAQS